MRQLEPLYLFNRYDDPMILSKDVSYDANQEMMSLFTDDERVIVNRNWDEDGGPRSRGWTSGTLGWLCDTTRGLKYGQTNYATFFAVAKEKRYFSSQVQTQFTAAVGCAVLTIDGYYLIQERAEGLLAGRRLDSSSAGMGIVRNGVLDFEYDIREKLKRELSMAVDHVIPTGIHGATDFVSSQVTYKCVVPWEFKEFKAKANVVFVQRIHPVASNNLADYLVKHYIHPNSRPSESLIADAVGVFLRVLPADEQEQTIKKLNTLGANIRWGVLRDGVVEID